MVDIDRNIEQVKSMTFSSVMGSFVTLLHK